VNRDEYLLWKAAEECAELTQRLAKAARFGMEDEQPTLPGAGTNRERIREEWKDLLVAMHLLGFGTHVTGSEERQRLERIQKYMDYSRAQGTLT